MKSLVIVWNRENRLTGYLYSHIPAASGVKLQKRFTASEHLSVGEQMREVFTHTDAQKCESIILAPYLTDALFIELLLPTTPLAELKDSLEFELPRQIPCQLEELEWGFRLLDNTGGFSRVRIIAAKRESWDQVVDTCLTAGVSIDAICHPYLAVATGRDEEDIYFPELSDYAWLQAAGDPVPLREAGQPSYSNSSAVEPAELIAEYALTGHFQRDKRFLYPLPGKLRPQRLRPLKFAVAAAGIAALVFGSVWWFRVWDDRQATRNAVIQEIEDIEYQIIHQLEKIGSMKPAGDAAGGIIKERAEVDVEDLLQQLSGNLLTNAWVTAFRTGSGKASLSIQVAGDTEPVVSFLNRNLVGFTVEALRQQLNNDGGNLLNVTLVKDGVEL